jgi:hypothetical protein
MPDSECEACCGPLANWQNSWKIIENMLRLRKRLLPAAQTSASGSNREADKAAAHWQHNTNLGEIFTVTL